MLAKNAEKLLTGQFVIMDATRKNLLTFGYVRDYCKQTDLDFLPEDIIHLFILWISFCDQFDRNLSHEGIQITEECDEEYGEYQQIKLAS